MTQTFLLTNAADAPRASATGLPCGFLCYRITDQGVLQRTPLPRATRGGLLGLMDAPVLPESALPRLRQALGLRYRQSDRIMEMPFCRVSFVTAPTACATAVPLASIK